MGYGLVNCVDTDTLRLDNGCASPGESYSRYPMDSLSPHDSPVHSTAALVRLLSFRLLSGTPLCGVLVWFNVCTAIN